MSYYGKDTIPNIDFNDNVGIQLFDKARLHPYTAKELNKIYGRHVERAFHGDFWSFQVCNSIAARLVYLKSAELMVA